MQENIYRIDFVYSQLCNYLPLPLNQSLKVAWYNSSFIIFIKLVTNLFYKSNEIKLLTRDKI